MASWSESSSYQGAASGASAGAMTGNPAGIAAGAVIGFVAGGLIGGSQEDAAREAEEERQREIQRAIERQNTADFNAKSMAEQWALADIGINKEDQVQDARANTQGLQANYKAATNRAAEVEKNYKYVEGMPNSFDEPFLKKRREAAYNVELAQGALETNEGIISSYNNTIKPSKY